MLLVKILSLGIAIPFTAIIILNLSLKVLAGQNYSLDLKKLFILYLCALTGWAVAIQAFMWG